MEVQIGNDITNLEVIRWLMRSQFDRNIVTLYDVQVYISFVFATCSNKYVCLDVVITLDDVKVWALTGKKLFSGFGNNKGADQPAHLCRMICTFVVWF